TIQLGTLRRLLSNQAATIPGVKPRSCNSRHVIRLIRAQLSPCYVRQQKTGVELLIPISGELRAAIDGAAAGDMTFLVTELGKPFTRVGFSNWFRRQCDMANLYHCSAHGTARRLRAASPRQGAPRTRS